MATNRRIPFDPMAPAKCLASGKVDGVYVQNGQAWYWRSGWTLGAALRDPPSWLSQEELLAWARKMVTGKEGGGG